MDGFWYVRYFAVVVEGDEDGSGVMKSCSVVIVMNDVLSRVGGRTEPTVERTVAASWKASGTFGTSPSSCRATRTAAVS